VGLAAQWRGASADVWIPLVYVGPVAVPADTHFSFPSSRVPPSSHLLCQMAHVLARATAALAVLVASASAGSNFPATAYTRAAAILAQMNTTEKLAMVRTLC
jgi:hypothetical protein